jgi:hypothetical protein
MKRKNFDGWVNYGSKDLRRYDFQPPMEWNNVRIGQEKKRIIEWLKAISTTPPSKDELGWVAVARMLPGELRNVLVLELEAGNTMHQIHQAGWPQAGSIFVGLKKFLLDKSLVQEPVVWRKIGDPHYWDQEYSQKVEGVEHLIVC